MAASAGDPPAVPLIRLPPLGGGRPSGPTAGLGTGDAVFRAHCQVAAGLILVIAAALVAVLVWRSWDSFRANGLGFFVSPEWDPEPTHRKFGALCFIYGTVVTSVIAMLIAVPLGVGTAAYLAEIAPHGVRRVGSFLVEMLAAIPSVVYGFWGLFVFAPAYSWLVARLGGPGQAGTGLVPAGLILGVMILPYVAAVSFDVIRAVPRSQREGALALGATRWQVISRVVIPYARPGIFGGCFLALGRALGETMAVTMLIGNFRGISYDFFGKGNSIPSVIANEFTEATYDLYLSSLVELGLVLLLVSVAFSAVGRLLIWRMSGVKSRPSLFGRALAFFRPASAHEEAAAPEQESAHEPGPNLEATPAPGGRRLPSNFLRAAAVSHVMTGVLGLCLVLSVLPLFLILGFLLYKGGSSLNWDFFTKLPAPVGQTGGGVANGIYGSALMVGIATLFSVPVGLMAAIYLAEYRSGRFGAAVRFVAELLGGVPSIVIGIFGYYVIVKPVTHHFSALAGGFALGVMMVPIILRASEEALKLVPRSLRNASLALGASQWQTTLRVTVPAALPAIITAIFLGIARVAGETAPLLLTASSNDFWPRSINDFTPSLPVYIFNYATGPYDDWHRMAWAAAFVLLAAVLILNICVRLAAGKRVLQASEAD